MFGTVLAVRAFVGMYKHDLRDRLIYDRKRDSIKAHLTIVFVRLAISPWSEDQKGWSISKFVRTGRRYRTIEIRERPDIITAAASCQTTSAKPSKRSPEPEPRPRQTGPLFRWMRSRTPRARPGTPGQPVAKSPARQTATHTVGSATRVEPSRAVPGTATELGGSSPGLPLMSELSADCRSSWRALSDTRSGGLAWMHVIRTKSCGSTTEEAGAPAHAALRPTHRPPFPTSLAATPSYITFSQS